MKRRVALIARLCSAVFCVGLAAFLSINVSAQTSSLRGTVRDAQGAVVNGATVTLQSEGKTFRRTALTNQDGNYVFTAVPPDSYRIEIEAKGFNSHYYLEQIPYDQLRIEKEIGECGFSTVYKGYWSRFIGLNKRYYCWNGDVALKKLKNSQNISDKFLKEVNNLI